MTTTQAQELRLELYTKLEKLEVRLREESTNANQYGFSESDIRTQMHELENRISETWAIR